MNTYDPADHIRYVFLDRTLGSAVLAGSRAFAASRLPSGYANESSRTRLRNRTALSPASTPTCPPRSA